MKVCNNNVMTDANGIIHLPLYGPSFIEKPEVPKIPKVDVKEMNKRFLKD